MPDVRRHGHGLIEDDCKAMFGRSGLGTGIISVRINMLPEIASITLGTEHGQNRSANKLQQ